ncbi:MAG: hypothetical protein OXD32_04550 [Endozoicomonadaceae bacterium]|nr:hypothetical protein [Endozoicomonadaceae bacterium]
MTVSAITKKAFALLTLYSLLNVFLTLNLYAKDSLPTIKNDTPWKVKFKYDWLGCGAFNKYKHKATDGSYLGPVEHTSSKKVSPNKKLTVKVGCFSRPGITVQITPYSLSNTFLNYLSITLIDGNIIACSTATCLCKSELCKLGNGYWLAPRDKALPILKYASYEKKNKYTGYSGYYWYMDTNQ